MKTGTLIVALLFAPAVVGFDAATAKADHLRRGRYDWYGARYCDDIPGRAVRHYGRYGYLPGQVRNYRPGDWAFHRGPYPYGRYRAGYRGGVYGQPYPATQFGMWSNPWSGRPFGSGQRFGIYFGF